VLDNSVSVLGMTSASGALSFRQRVALGMRWYLRSELPGWGKLFGALGLQDSWPGPFPRVLRGKWHGYAMDLDLGNWSDRHSYFIGRFYDLPLQLLMRQYLAEGARFVDVGANIGHISLLASRLVGNGGTVDSFEPNPVCVGRIRSAVEKNRIANLRLHPMGLSDTEASFELSVFKGHTGTATLARLDPGSGEVAERVVSVPVVRGDSVLLNDATPVRFVKIDVEGFETYAVRGIRGMLERDYPVVVTEFAEGHLRRAGSSREELAGLFVGMGYSACGFEAVPSIFTRRYSVRVLPVGAGPNGGGVTSIAAEDVLWVHPRSTIQPV